MGRSDLYCQARAPVLVSIAVKVPLGGIFKFTAMLPALYWPMIGVPGL